MNVNQRNHLEDVPESFAGDDSVSATPQPSPSAEAGVEAVVRRGALARRALRFDLSPAETGASTELVAAFQVKSPQAESLRGIRSRLHSAWSKTPPVHGRIAAIVSPDAKEGRSWFTANLAVAFCQLGERTLIIDGDLRSPRQHSLFGLKNDAGVSTLDFGDIPYQQTTLHSELVLLPAGPPVPNPQEVIASAQFSEMLDRAAAEFDVVLIDSPPLVDFADAEILADRAGSALFVARRNVSRVKLMDYYFNLLHRSSITVLGSALIG